MKYKLSLIAASSLSLSLVLLTAARADDVKKTQQPINTPANLSSQVIPQDSDAKKVAEERKQKEETQDDYRPFHAVGALENAR